LKRAGIKMLKNEEWKIEDGIVMKEERIYMPERELRGEIIYMPERELREEIIYVLERKLRGEII